MPRTGHLPVPGSSLRPRAPRGSARWSSGGVCSAEQARATQAKCVAHPQDPTRTACTRAQLRVRSRSTTRALRLLLAACRENRHASTLASLRTHNHLPNHSSEIGPDGPTLLVTVSPRLFSFLRRGSTLPTSCQAGRRGFPNGRSTEVTSPAPGGCGETPGLVLPDLRTIRSVRSGPRRQGCTQRRSRPTRLAPRFRPTRPGETLRGNSGWARSLSPSRRRPA